MTQRLVLIILIAFVGIHCHSVRANPILVLSCSVQINTDTTPGNAFLEPVGRSVDDDTITFSINPKTGDLEEDLANITGLVRFYKWHRTPVKRKLPKSSRNELSGSYEFRGKSLGLFETSAMFMYSINRVTGDFFATGSYGEVDGNGTRLWQTSRLITGTCSQAARKF